MPVFVQSQVRLMRINRALVARLASTILSAVGESSSEISLTFVGDRRMRRLNREYRHKDRTTDVLAFAMREGPSCRSNLLGDVVIAVPTAVRQAGQGNRSFDEEVAVLLVHGILHLCGYDHERSEAEADRMHRREGTILRQLGKIPHLVHPTRK